MNTKTVFRLIVLVVFLGWVTLWFLLPTKKYKNTWTPWLNNRLNTTYFGGQAVVGCVYLHVQSKSKKNDSKRHVVKSHRFMTFWGRPVFVMAPLGIVTAVELAFAAIQRLKMIDPLEFGLVRWQAKFRSVSLRLGYVGNICWAFLFFSVTRGSSLLPFLGLSSESSIKYHIWLGHLSMVLFSAHTIGFLIHWGMTHQMSQTLQWAHDRVPNVAGEIAIVFAWAIWMTSFSRVRRKMFEVFFYTHHLYALYIFFYLLHVGVVYFCMILPGIFLFLVDRFLRFLQSRRRSSLVSARLLPCDTIELNFCKSQGFNYGPTSVLFINVPSISKLQWHPFTVTSNCNMEPDKLSIVIKTSGSWSRKLFQLLSNSPVDHLKVSVEGPYGSTSSPFLRNSTDLAMLDLLLPISVTTTEISKVQLQIEAYVTREIEQPPTESQKLIHTIRFKPDPSDSPITPVLGPKLKRNSLHIGKQIQNLEMQTPTSSPGSWFGVGDRELESLPQQSLVQATKVHYGARPDLKKILSECKGSDIGVLVSGPRTMRHEVAKICSSGLVENVHFEAMSFNW
ncbi:putative ferric reduction oxidase 1 [Morella rubra]|uniref:Putative ferric reduction oxidase 1 n=1 Tax=Morella rubra TaxID=262757 RepID=A0A6A1W736_9ROSI|nr:putative ferric reduction oxidase 1 [Morella rubra]